MNNFSNIQFFFVLDYFVFFVSELNSCLFMKNAGTCFRIRKKKKHEKMEKYESIKSYVEIVFYFYL